MEWIALWFSWHLRGVAPLRWSFPGCCILGMDCVAPLDSQLGGHQQSGFHLTLQNLSLPGIIIPPGAQSNRHAKASSSSTAWLEEAQESFQAKVTDGQPLKKDFEFRVSHLTYLSRYAKLKILFQIFSQIYFLLSIWWLSWLEMTQ